MIVTDSRYAQICAQAERANELEQQLLEHTHRVMELEIALKHLIPICEMFIGRSFQEQLSSAGQTLEACKNTLNEGDS
jgi:hypothetical protein